MGIGARFASRWWWWQWREIHEIPSKMLQPDSGYISYHTQQYINGVIGQSQGFGIQNAKNFGAHRI